MLSFNLIINGWANLLKSKLHLLDSRFKEEAELRLMNCHRCHLIDGYICSTNRKGINIQTGKLTKGCGCVITAKVMSEQSECPLLKWKSYDKI
jgi:hypothetical protein